MSKLRQKQRKDKRKKLQQKNTTPALWSIPTPHHNLPSINGKVRLYHYTQHYCLGSILEHGIIFGDTIANAKDFSIFSNAPNLTSENQFHNPANKSKNHLENSDYLRLEVYFDEDDAQIVNYGWFDKTFVKNKNRKLIDHYNKQGLQNGDIDKQFIYRGVIEPTRIKKISRWNADTGYWDRLSKNEITEYCKLFNPTSYSFNGLGHPTFNAQRLMGTHLGDQDFTAGGLKRLFRKTKKFEVLCPIYDLNDQLITQLKGEQLKTHLGNVCRLYRSQKIEQMINYIVTTYLQAFKKSPKKKNYCFTAVKEFNARMTAFVQQSHKHAPVSRVA